ncbi:translation initiation factor IF-3 [Solicola gregarius]|uniref:Translation initiation factor IF-3 n=1 Tax=Solicola gregarius TaxID=2908642 RepID=A0AA46YLU9_9ACTN|nr:translation initiation factor IF-3 [Solicola gregarius]UYM05218.1 translation initiation factor IF-3 [Solicola gregarius]
MEPTSHPHRPSRSSGSVGSLQATVRTAPATLLGGLRGLQTHRTPGGPISNELRVNDRIRVAEVRLVGPNGEQVGIVRIDDALRLAQESDLDLVEVAPTARPPVCRLMDYGKFKYEAAQKARESRRNQTNTIIKEMKLRPKIDQHDYDTKKGHVVRFLRQGDKVKITIMFRGREQHRPELGFRLLQRLSEDVDELGFVEAAPRQDGRNMTMVLAPHKKKAEARKEAKEEKARAASEREAEREAEKEYDRVHREEHQHVAPAKPRRRSENIDPDVEV